jgi:hypothetical protein
VLNEFGDKMMNRLQSAESNLLILGVIIPFNLERANKASISNEQYFVSKLANWGGYKHDDSKHAN